MAKKWDRCACDPIQRPLKAFKSDLRVAPFPAEDLQERPTSYGTTLLLGTANDLCRGIRSLGCEHGVQHPSRYLSGVLPYKTTGQNGGLKICHSLDQVVELLLKRGTLGSAARSGDI
ncbi:hypothetical protein ABZ918_10375 [Streptomyces viridosporus]|uniref:hypothetical protein n=1 Tax=Streptomyces viridosporus TaxID=67581 RepID=UPI00342D906F